MREGKMKAIPSSLSPGRADSMILARVAGVVGVVVVSPVLEGKNS